MAAGDKVGDRLRIVREALGYPNQTAFAEAIGVAKQGTVSQYETGATIPKRWVLVAVAGLCQDRAAVEDWLVHGGQRPPILPLANAAPRTVADWIAVARDALDAIEARTAGVAPADPVAAAGAAHDAIDATPPPRRDEKGSRAAGGQ